ncbi:MAG: InlB B-repeat-containing protein, partial [Clostridia bacterium]|nr:InlB B-repeat-containing protein [Clostridia bacterium]
SVNAPLTINYVYADGTEAAETYTDSVEIFKDYSVTSPEIEGYTPDIAKVEGTMGDEDMGGKTVTVTYTANTYKVTYVVDGEKLTEMDATFGQSVPRPRTPQRDGYSFKWVDEIPATMPAQDVTINGKFTVIEYTATFVDENGETVEAITFTVETESITEPAVPAKEGYDVKWSAYTLAAADITIPAEYKAREYTAKFVDENGKTVKEVKFTVETVSLDEPAVPEKTNYTGKWEEYTLGAKDITIKPVYTLGSKTVVIKVNLGYKESKKFTFEPKYVPEGATVRVFFNGEDRGEGTSIEVKEPTGSYTVECKVFDKDGNEIASSGEIRVEVKNSFFDRLQWFFSDLLENILKLFTQAAC